MKLSVIVPSFHEPYLAKTIESVLKNAHGEIEVIAILDGWQPDYPLPKDERVRIINLVNNRGPRGATNEGMAASKAKYVMKIDSHSAVAPGFDEILTASMQPNWMVVPRKYSLDVNSFEPDMKRTPVDYTYLSFPTESAWGLGMYARDWIKMRWKRSDPKYDIDDIMTLQASCWMVERDYFMKQIYPMDDRPQTYGPLAQDQQELALKYWLKGGEVKVNKKTWHAHFGKRWYHYSQKTFSRLHKKDEMYIKGNRWGTLHWIRDEEPGIIHPFSWYIEKFSPIPEWGENWQEELQKFK